MNEIEQGVRVHKNEVLTQQRFTGPRPNSMSYVKLTIAFLFLLAISCVASAQSTIIVPPGGDLQAAINSSRYGDTIVLSRDSRYFAPKDDAFLWPAKPGCTGASYVTITTKGWNYVGRVTNGEGMAKIVARHGRGAIQLLANSGCLALRGVEVTNQSSGTQREHVQDLLGSAGGGYSRTSKPAHFIIDQCYIHPQEDGLPANDPNYNFRTASHGVAWNVADLTIKNSRLTGFIGAYRNDQKVNIDSEAIAYSTGPGPLNVINNWIDAWYAGILTGGADTDSDNFGTILSAQSNSVFTISVTGGTAPVAGDMLSVANPGKEYSACKVQSVSRNTVTCKSTLVWNAQQNTGGPDALSPAPIPIVGQNVKWRGYEMRDINVIGNTFTIDPVFAQFWKIQSGNNPKGYIEFKNGINILLDGNTFDGWPTSVGFGLQNQSGSSPWSAIQNVTVSNNLFRRYSYAFGPMSVTGYSRLTERGRNFSFINNLAFGNGGGNDVNGHHSAFFTMGVSDGPVFVTNNTVIDTSDGFTVQVYPLIAQGTFRNNILPAKNYGHQCLPSGGHAMQCYGTLDSKKNIIVNTKNLNPADIQSYWWPGSTVPRTYDGVKFVGPCGRGTTDIRNCALSPLSPGYRAGSDGKDIGVDIPQLLAHLSGNAPVPTATPTPTVTPPPLPGPASRPRRVEPKSLP